MSLQYSLPWNENTRVCLCVTQFRGSIARDFKAKSLNQSIHDRLSSLNLQPTSWLICCARACSSSLFSCILRWHLPPFSITTTTIIAAIGENSGAKENSQFFPMNSDTSIHYQKVQGERGRERERERERSFKKKDRRGDKRTASFIIQVLGGIIGINDWRGAILGEETKWTKLGAAL